LAKAAFNVFDYETIRAVYEAARKTGEGVYLQFSASTVGYYGANRLRRIIDSIETEPNTEVIVHLDHCSNFQIIGDCIANGWDSIMADFSNLPLSENISKVNEIRSTWPTYCGLIEGELGAILGEEDGFDATSAGKVNLNELEEFCNKTAIDLLAIGIGNAHGHYISTKNLDIDLWIKAHQIIPNQKLVLHGASGIEMKKIGKIKEYGLEKVNISTELKDVYIDSFSNMVRINKYAMIKYVEDRYEKTLEFCVKKINELK